MPEVMEAEASEGTLELRDSSSAPEHVSPDSVTGHLEAEPVHPGQGDGGLLVVWHVNCTFYICSHQALRPASSVHS